ncbi:type 1 fimbrial protein [Salmonella enterica]|nr:type 1 fimbrial protein [Salmonella enterica]EJF5172794.1 type 1 fimbrial protein [Salmonella enterica]ELS1445640.1 type 1 fimbrial protein [Salmonella enterica]
MKKSMAGQGMAGALLLAGLMVSAGAMAASGDPVTGGSGTVTINVPIVTSTCSVSVPTEVNFDPMDKSSITGVRRIINTKEMDITLSHCNGKTLLMNTRGHAVSPSDNTYGYFSSGDPDNALQYEVLVPMSTEITDGQSSDGSSWYVYLNNTYPLTIKPNSDSYQIASLIELLSTGKSVSNLGSAVSGGFDYTFTYQ